VSFYREGKKVVTKSGRVLGTRTKIIGESVIMAADDEFSELSGATAGNIQVGDKVITK